MKKLICFFLILFCYTTYSQKFLLYDMDTTAFTTMKASFFSLDANGNQIINFSTSDFEVKENGQLRSVLSVSCPTSQPPILLSSVLVMDVSGSMDGVGLSIAKASANAWIDMLPLSTYECAITSFNGSNVLNQDFTKDKSKLINAINNLSAQDGTNYDAALIDRSAGGILIAKTGKYKRVIVFLTDGAPNNEPRTSEIINEALSNNITIYCVTINMFASQCMIDMANQTGGLYFENIKTKEEAEDCYRKIIMIAQGGNPCTLEWKSEISCEMQTRNVEVKLIPYNLTAKSSYSYPYSNVPRFKFYPSSLSFKNITKDTCITVKVTARNASFNVTNIIASNNIFKINPPTSFHINEGESRNITICYSPPDSNYIYCKITFETDLCPLKYYINGGFMSKKPNIPTIKLIHPNGGEEFIVGSDTIITWEGILPEEKVLIEYSTNSGTNWDTITTNGAKLSYTWRVPNTPSNKCLAKVTALLGYEPLCPDVQICDQLWMGCNLDVDHYRNGDSIPEVRDATEWANLTTGAWCYYDNDPANGKIYGKLYNWYAVNDPRGLAPEGWHIATDDEWKKLENCLGGSSVAGGKLKSTGTIEEHNGLWYSPNILISNEYNFLALPGGWRTNYGSFFHLGYYGLWWSASENDYLYSWYEYIGSMNSSLLRNCTNKENGFTVRCIRD